MNPDDELKQLMERYHAPQAAGVDLAMRDIALSLWGQFQLSLEDDGYSKGRWFQPLYFSQQELRNYKKHHAPAGLIVDNQKGMVDYDPKQVAQFMIRTARTDFEREQNEDTLRGLSKVIDWLITLQTELAENLRRQE